MNRSALKCCSPRASLTPAFIEIDVFKHRLHRAGRQANLVQTLIQPLCPGIAPAAKQEGTYVANVIRARLSGAPAPPPFHYKHAGDLATIGKRRAVIDFGWIKLHGTVAWLLWGLVHISFLIGFRNRLVVMLDWIWSYVTFQSGARLITGPPDSR